MELEKIKFLEAENGISYQSGYGSGRNGEMLTQGYIYSIM